MCHLLAIRHQAGLGGGGTCLLTDPYSSPLLFMARYRPLSTPLMLTSPTARLMNSKMPENTDALYVNATQLFKHDTARITPNLFMRKIGFEATFGVKRRAGPFIHSHTGKNLFVKAKSER